jgi:DNA topoisomerase-1
MLNYRIAARVVAKYMSKKNITNQSGEKVTVYEYSENHLRNRTKRKSEQIQKLKKHMSDLRTKIKKDMSSEDLKTKLTALAVALMDQTYERVGNEGSASEGHFGVTGWKKKHISFNGKNVTFKYVGKSGVKHEKKIDDSGTRKLLKEFYDELENDNSDLFSQEGAKVTAKDINAYLEEFEVTAKDIRGFHANREMQEALKEVRAKGGKIPSDKKEREKQLKKEFKEALKTTAEKVGHEEATLRNQYLMPNIEADYIKDGTVES